MSEQLALQTTIDRMEGALRVFYWNEAKRWGASDDRAIAYVNERIATLKDRVPA